MPAPPPAATAAILRRRRRTITVYRWVDKPMVVAAQIQQENNRWAWVVYPSHQKNGVTGSSARRPDAELDVEGLLQRRGFTITDQERA